MSDSVNTFLALWMHTNVAFTDYGRLEEYEAYADKVQKLADYVKGSVEPLPDPTCSCAEGLLGLRWSTERGCMTVEVKEDGSFFWVFSTPLKDSSRDVVMGDDSLQSASVDVFLHYLRTLVGGA